MNLPNAAHAQVEQAKIVAKIVDYLLAPEHPEGAGKAGFFAHFGFTVEAWQVLAEALLAHARTHPVASMSETRYGTKYRIEGSFARTGALRRFGPSGSSTAEPTNQDWSQPIPSNRVPA